MIKKYFAVFSLSLFIFCFIITLNNAFAENVSLENLGASFIAYFDTNVSNDIPENNGIINHGASIISDGINGNALQLLNNEYIEIDPKLLFSGTEGSLSFWVRPHWSYSASVSHTFLSFSWGQVDNCYFVLSDGWWEDDAGGGYTYFIFNNQARVKSHIPVYYKQGEWVHFVLTWKHGGFAKLYINGALSRDSEHVVENFHEIRNKVIFGADKGCYISKDRWADIDLDELVAFTKVLSSDEILNLYKSNTVYSPLSAFDGVVNQIRVICDEDRDWTTVDGANESIHKLKNAGFNVYIPCVWHGGGTRFPSGKAVSESGLTFNDGDPLDRVIKLAHDNNVELHAWFCVAKRKDDVYKEFHDDSLPIAFNIHRPEFREFIINLIVDTVERYDVDGIVLDYIRTMGISTSDYSVQDYRRRFDRDLLKDIDLGESAYKLEPHIQQWLDDDVEDIVKSVSERTRQIKSGVKISIFGKAIPAFLGTNPEGRQEVKWANKGYLDVIFHMDYSDSPDFERIEVVKNEIEQQVYVVPVLGNYTLYLISNFTY